MRAFLFLAALALSPAAAHAQCNVTFTPYGSGCNSVFFETPVLSGDFDPQACTAAITLGGFPGCCNTFLTQRLFVFGVNPARIPLPQFGAGCTLLVQRLVHVALPPNENTIKFEVPVGLPSFTLYAQGINVYFTTIGLTTDLAFSQGLQLDFS